MIILKKLNIPLCDLRLQHNFRDVMGRNGVTTSEMTSDKTHLDLVEAGEIGMKKRLRSQEEVKVVKRRIVKVLDVDPKDEHNTDEDSSSEEDNHADEDPEFSLEKEKKKMNKVSKGESVLHTVKRDVSDYEKMIQKNREENMSFLQSLKIQEAKSDLFDVIGNMKKKKRQCVKRKYEKEVSPPVLRKSLRLANFSIDFSERALFSNAVITSQETEEPKKSIPPELTFKEALGSEELYKSYVNNVSILETKSEAKFVAYDKSDLKKMTVCESNIAKVTPSRIMALAWYPSSEQLIVTAGDKYGNLGVWNVDSESNPYVMKIHVAGITNMQFNPFNQIQLVSSSYDGILRYGDMIQQRFFEIYNVSDETCCKYFDVLSATTYLVAQTNGMVALVDRRTRGKSSRKKHNCHDYSINCVNIHPVNRNFFVTADNRGSIRLWDLRMLQKNPVADITHHKRCVQSAYFSPVTGNSILATSNDDSVSIFDSTKLTSEIKLKQLMKHNNQTGRWLSKFSATWLPNSEEAFVIGSMQYPRKIEVFDKNMFAYNMMIHENLTTITSINAFHPMKSTLAAGNSSGKVFIFT